MNTSHVVRAFCGPLAGVALLASCAVTPAETYDSVEQAIGEPVGELPNHDERVLGFWTNRIRAAPGPFDALLSPDGTTPSGRPIPSPTPPLELVADLARAAHFQSNHIATTTCPLCADHSTCCVLAGQDEDTHCEGAVTACGVTSQGERFSHFSDRASTENAEEGNSKPELAMLAWITSHAHWGAINGAGYTALGTGAVLANRYAHHLVFGVEGSYPVAGDGTHFYDLSRDGSFMVKEAPVTNPTFGITYYLPGGGAPKVAEVVRSLDGGEAVCDPLALKYGTEAHGTYEKAMTLESGCHRYFFHLVDSNGTERMYPTTGTLGVPINVSADKCPDFSAARFEAPCAGTPASSGEGGAGGSGSGSGGGSGGAGGSGGDGGDDSGGASGCGCRAAPVGFEVTGGGLLFLALAAWARRRALR
ncbi:hypothetical protein [Polyangium sorediatum]|uniref:SCP domain-containing protein n=1 Tax=Polyangium sorediatum TaxID=889274 RepID=A0ABT6P9K2_9BACT|nr:hypothetical protein [Polyangium sorediatum]MDI1436952.1 hypothetical protein [Polyangium sorediatum]